MNRTYVATRNVNDTYTMDVKPINTFSMTKDENPLRMGETKMQEKKTTQS